MITSRARPTVPCLIIALAGVFAGGANAADGPQSKAPANAIGIGATYLSPGSPLEGGPGVAVFFSRGLVGGMPREDGTRVARYSLRAGIEGARYDRKAEEATGSGRLTVTRLSVGVARTLGRTGVGWAFSLGAGLDYLIASGDGTYRSPVGVGITNRYDADSGGGFHADFLAEHRLSAGWGFFASVGYASSSLDGKHRYVIDGVASAPVGVKFDIKGPRVAAGAQFRY